MPSQPEMDDISAFEAKETAKRIPAGFALLFWGLISWGAYYLWTYTPALGGWDQSQDLEGGGASTGVNLLATIAFTAMAALAAIVLLLRQRRRKS